MFNLFRICGDLMHLASIFILMLKMLSAKNCRGISLKTQLLYAIVFLTRYLDLFWNFSSLYNWVMKVFFIATACTVVYMMKFRKPYCDTYDSRMDSFSLAYIIAPCAVLALIINEEFSIFEILWTFSIYLEAIAIIPQLFMVHGYAKQQNGFVENLTSHYVFTLGGYRAMYLLNWIWRVFTESGYRNWIVWIAGLVQTAIYCDFFYYYFVAWKEGQKHVMLPL